MERFGVRVEAKGFEPKMFAGIEKTKDSKRIVFRLKKDKGIKGRVLLSNGKPAARAEVGVKMTSRQLKLRGTTLVNGDTNNFADDWSCGIIVQANELGGFELPRETDPSAFVVAVHQGGTIQVPFSQLYKNNQITLVKW